MDSKKVIPIRSVSTRANNLELFSSEYMNKMGSYPILNENAHLYDINDWLCAIRYWKSFSESVTNNIDQVCNVLHIISESGTEQDLREATRFICNNIIPSLKNPNEFKYNFNKLREDTNLTKYIDIIIDKLQEQVECDRVINNYNIVMKRFNIDKMFCNILTESTREDIIIDLCNLIDTYQLNFKSKYCIANEVALYTSSKYLDNIPRRIIEDTIIDYFIMYHNQNDIPKTLDTIRDSINKDLFISNEALDYVDYINKVYYTINGRDYYEKDIIEEESVLNERYNNQPAVLQFIFHYDEYDAMNESRKIVLTEMDLLDQAREKAKELITQIKISNVKTRSAAENAVQHTITSFPYDKAGEAVKTVLKVTFLILVTLGAFALGAFAVILGFTANFIYNRWFSDKALLREALEEMREHQKEVYYKYKTEPVIERKQRLLEYSTQLDKQVKSMESKYDKLEDEPNSITKASDSTADKAKDVADTAIKGMLISSFINNVAGMGGGSDAS